MRKIITRDSELNILTELRIYEASEYHSDFGPYPNTPVLTSDNGRIDPALIPPSLSIIRVAHENLMPGDVVRPASETEVQLATQNAQLADAMVLGVVVDGGVAGSSVRVRIMGTMTNSQYQIFDLNSVLYLADNGLITDERPTTGFLVPIGKALGQGTIMIQISYPTMLGA